ncbi:putative membrane protein [Pseudomonas sp. GM50]|nr:putative membrane protein [Pseudomonas sp. GM50]
MFILINLGIAILLGIIDALLGAKGFISNAYSLAMFVPSIAAAIRRMHDTNRSGWWILLPIVNIVFLAQDSQPGDNRFGPNPKGIN